MREERAAESSLSFPGHQCGHPQWQGTDMGCTPSKSSAMYTQEKICRDLDTCSTFVPSLKSSLSTPERPSPRLCLETSSGRQTFLSVPCRNSHGRIVNQPNTPDAWSTFCTAPTNPVSLVQTNSKASNSDSNSSDNEAIPNDQRLRGP